TVHTRGGEAPVEVAEDGQVTVDMGIPEFREGVSEIELDNQRLEVVALSIGNPHCVIFRDKLDITELRRIGPLVEHHAAFPNRTNVQLARVVDRQTVELFIWERGAGETQASGSSSCAVVGAAHRIGLVGTDVAARMPGGELFVHIEPDGRLWLRGPVEEVAQISLSQQLIRRLQALP